MREHERRTLFAVDPLRHSRRPFGGMWADIKKLVRRYPSDLRDMFHIQVHVMCVVRRCLLLGDREGLIGGKHKASRLLKSTIYVC